MSGGFYTATICADCEPPVIAVGTASGYGSRCPRCGNAVEHTRSLRALDDGPLARQILRDVAVRSDGDAYLLAELARRMLERVGKAPR